MQIARLAQQRVHELEMPGEGHEFGLGVHRVREGKGKGAAAWVLLPSVRSHKLIPGLSQCVRGAQD